jgi:signal transduction histidine kinase
VKDSLHELFFTQSLDGFFIMMLDQPIDWTDTCDKDATLDYVFTHQRLAVANEAFARHYRRPLSAMIGVTTADFWAHDVSTGKAGWRAMFDDGRLHVETDERPVDGTAVRIEGHYLCLYDDRRRIIGHLGIQRDITERHREEERKRIARELHDELGQAVTGLKLDLAWLEHRLSRQPTANLARRTHELLQRLDVIIASVRRIVTQLRPSVLDELGLAAAVEWQAQEFATRTGIAVDLTSDVNDSNPLPDPVASAVFRMLQEALTNVARHAGAGRVRVALHQDTRLLSLDVADDGRGISESELHGRRSLGLLGLRERAIASGGTVEIRGEPGRGTTVSVKLPLPAMLQ